MGKSSLPTEWVGSLFGEMVEKVPINGFSTLTVEGRCDTIKHRYLESILVSRGSTDISIVLRLMYRYLNVSLFDTSSLKRSQISFLLFIPQDKKV